MNKTLRYLIVLFGVILLFYLDFVRDYVFKNIGFQIYYLNHLSSTGYASVTNYTDSFIESYIHDYSSAQLYNLKWIFTAIFSIVFGVLGAVINSIFHQTKKIFLYFSILYVVLFFSSLLIYSTMYLSENFTFQNKAYLISMEIAHFLQSSLPSLLFLVSFKLYQQNKQ